MTVPDRLRDVDKTAERPVLARLPGDLRGDIRCIRKGPGEEWLAICAFCGRRFPLVS